MDVFRSGYFVDTNHIDIGTGGPISKCAISFVLQVPVAIRQFMMVTAKIW